LKRAAKSGMELKGNTTGWSIMTICRFFWEEETIEYMKSKKCPIPHFCENKLC
jgi:hypothetical protein